MESRKGLPPPQEGEIERERERSVGVRMAGIEGMLLAIPYF